MFLKKIITVFVLSFTTATVLALQLDTSLHKDLPYVSQSLTPIHASLNLQSSNSLENVITSTNNGNYNNQPTNINHLNKVDCPPAKPKNPTPYKKRKKVVKTLSELLSQPPPTPPHLLIIHKHKKKIKKVVVSCYNLTDQSSLQKTPPVVQTETEDTENKIIHLKIVGIRGKQIVPITTDKTKILIENDILKKYHLTPLDDIKEDHCDSCTDLSKYGTLTIDEDTGEGSFQFDHDHLKLIPPQNFNLLYKPTTPPQSGDGFWINYNYNQNIYPNRDYVFIPALNYSNGKNYFYSSFDINNHNTFRQLSYYLYKGDDIYFQMGDDFTPGNYLNSYFYTGAEISSTYESSIYPYPYFSMSGTAQVPSIFSLFLNDRPLAQGSVEAGPFTIDGIPGQYGTLYLNLKDQFGNVTTVNQSVYAPNLLLREGLSQYDVFVGKTRIVNTEQYGAAVAGGQEVYGLTNNITLNGSLQYVNHYYSTGGGITVGSPIVTSSFQVGNNDDYLNYRVTLQRDRASAYAFIDRPKETGLQELKGYGFSYAFDVPLHPVFAYVKLNDEDSYTLALEKSFGQWRLDSLMGKTIGQNRFAYLGLLYNFGAIKSYTQAFFKSNTISPVQTVYGNYMHPESETDFRVFMAPTGQITDNVQEYSAMVSQTNEHGYFMATASQEGNSRTAYYQAMGTFVPNSRQFTTFVYPTQSILQIDTKFPNVQIYVSGQKYRTNYLGIVSIPVYGDRDYFIKINVNTLPFGWNLEHNKIVINLREKTFYKYKLDFEVPGVILKPDFSIKYFIIGKEEYQVYKDTVYANLKPGVYLAKTNQGNFKFTIPEVFEEQDVIPIYYKDKVK